jgi:hypothetical protein
VPRFRAPTPGTRLAVWTFPALTAWLGAGYLFADRARFTSPAFAAAKDVTSLRNWGVVFLAVAAFKAFCLLTDRARLFIGAMCLGVGLYSVWAFLFAVAFWSDDRTSPGAPAWPVFVIAAHLATLETLTGGALSRAVRRLWRR